MTFTNVFEPLQLRNRTLRSRINFGAHTANMAVEGLPSDRHLGYYCERALGGVGMIVVEPVPVHRTAVLTRGNFRPDDDAVIPGFRRIVEACHEAAAASVVGGDVVMIQQLYHVGQHGDADNSFAPNWSPSGLPSYHDADGSHSMTDGEIVETIDAFVRAATRAQRCGFDGIELFAAYHAIIDQFWTPWSNRRDDRWGATFEDRMRFSSSLLQGIRDVCGDDFVVGLAVSIDPESEPSLSTESMQEIVAWHDERALMDYVSCGTGSYFDFHKLMPTSLYPQRYGERFAAALKQVTSHALVQAESHIRTPQAADDVIGAGHADMVSIVRGQIADPHLVAKAHAGHADRVRPCISCNQMCWARRSRDYWISCLVNPSAGREFEWGGDRFVPSDSPRRVLVVGAGPAGMEVARVAAERGHTVTLLEAADELGGQYRLAGRQPSRNQIGDHIGWFGRSLARLSVDVQLGVRADADLVAAWLAADAHVDASSAIVVATGAMPARQGFQRALPMVDLLPGSDAPSVAAIHDVLDGSVVPSGRVLVVDDLDDWRGIGTAMRLQEDGCEVTIVTSAPVVAGGLFHSAADVPARRRFVTAGGTMQPNAIVEEWLPGTGARIRSTLTGAASVQPFEHLVIAETARPDTALGDELRRRGTAFETIGDCVAARRASFAFHEARSLGLRL